VDTVPILLCMHYLDIYISIVFFLESHGCLFYSELLVCEQTPDLTSSVTFIE